MNTLKTKTDGNYAKLSINKSLLKEYNTSDCSRTVYMNDGDEFQIQLFNPETTEIAAEITIDNESLTRMIVLSPGERMWLERYTDSPNKFKFRVYKVDGDSKVVEKAIQHNGDVVIKFYRKRNAPKIVHYYSQPDYIYVDHTPNVYWWNNTLTASNGINTNYSVSASSAKGNTRSMNAATMDSVELCNYCCDMTGLTGCANYQSSAATLSCSDAYDASSCNTSSLSFAEPENTIETGRVGKGSHSDQEFEDVNMDFDYWSFRTETFKILPVSRKPYTATDARKLYCPNCGRKLNTKFKFCPYCGEKID